MLTARCLMSKMLKSLACLTLIMLSCHASADCPFPCSVMSLTPVLTGGDGYNAGLIYVGDYVTVTGLQIEGDATHSEGVLIQALVPGRTFDHLTVTSNYLGNFIIAPAMGADGSRPWVETQTSNGITLDWQPSAHKLGEAASVAGVGTRYYELALKLDTTASSQRDLTAFGASTFTVQATPEPGLFILGSFMGGLTLLLWKERRRTMRQRP